PRSSLFPYTTLFRSKLLLLAIGVGLLVHHLVLNTARADSSGASSASSVTDVLTVAQQQADFDLMRRALEEAHGGIYRYSTKGQRSEEHTSELQSPYD